MTSERNSDLFLFIRRCNGFANYVFDYFFDVFRLKSLNFDADIVFLLVFFGSDGLVLVAQLGNVLVILLIESWETRSSRLFHVCLTLRGATYSNLTRLFAHILDEHPC